MVLTTTQTTEFFENANQMAIPHTTVLQLRHESITSVADLVDFDKTSISQIADNLRRSGGVSLTQRLGHRKVLRFIRLPSSLALSRKRALT